METNTSPAIPRLLPRELAGAPARSPRLRLLVGHEHPLIRRGLRAVFDAEPDFEVVHEVGDGTWLPGLVRDFRPQVVVLDADLPAMDMLETVVRLVGDEHFRCGVVLMAEQLDVELAIAALRAGVRGLVYKDDHPDELVRAIRAVAAGDALLSSRVTVEVVDGLRHRPVAPLPRREGEVASAPSRQDAVAIAELSPRELQIFRMIAQGRTNQEIADALLLTHATVKSHFNRIGKKLGLRGRVQAVLMAYRIGLVPARQ